MNIQNVLGGAKRQETHGQHAMLSKRRGFGVSSKAMALGCAIALSLVSNTAMAQTVDLYLDEVEWLEAVASVEVFDFTASAMAQADEVPTPPGPMTNLGQVLTFESKNTGLSTSFRLTSLNDDWIFEDRLISEHLSPGAIDPGGSGPHEDDDFMIELLSPQRHAVSIIISNNNVADSEEIVVRGEGDEVLASFPLLLENDEQFYGIVSSVPMHSVTVDEGSDEEDITTARLQLADLAATPPQDIPTLSAAVQGLLWIAIAVLGVARLRRHRVQHRVQLDR